MDTLTIPDVRMRLRAIPIWCLVFLTPAILWGPLACLVALFGWSLGAGLWVVKAGLLFAGVVGTAFSLLGKWVRVQTATKIQYVRVDSFDLLVLKDLLKEKS